jgi:hypothetical protein
MKYGMTIAITPKVATIIAIVKPMINVITLFPYDNNCTINEESISRM